MKIRVKYCGGCNPRYDRAARVQGLCQHFSQHSVGYTGEEADYVVVVCGCTAACADHEALYGHLGKTVVSCEKEWDALFRHLEALNSETNEEGD